MCYSHSREAEVLCLELTSIIHHMEDVFVESLLLQACAMFVYQLIKKTATHAAIMIRLYLCLLVHCISQELKIGCSQ